MHRGLLLPGPGLAVEEQRPGSAYGAYDGCGNLHRSLHCHLRIYVQHRHRFAYGHEQNVRDVGACHRHMSGVALNIDAAGNMHGAANKLILERKTESGALNTECREYGGRE